MVGNTVEALEVLNRVNQFYNSSMTWLLAVLGIGLAVIGVVMPVVIQRLQARSFRKEAERERKAYREDAERVYATFRDHVAQGKEEWSQKHLELEGDMWLLGAYTMGAGNRALRCHMLLTGAEKYTRWKQGAEGVKSALEEVAKSCSSSPADIAAVGLKGDIVNDIRKGVEAAGWEQVCGKALVRVEELVRGAEGSGGGEEGPEGVVTSG